MEIFFINEITLISKFAENNGRYMYLIGLILTLAILIFNAFLNKTKSSERLSIYNFICPLIELLSMQFLFALIVSWIGVGVINSIVVVCYWLIGVLILLSFSLFIKNLMKLGLSGCDIDMKKEAFIVISRCITLSISSIIYLVMLSIISNSIRLL